jgi:hypothetical protein
MIDNNSLEHCVLTKPVPTFVRNALGSGEFRACLCTKLVPTFVRKALATKPAILSVIVLHVKV